MPSVNDIASIAEALEKSPVAVLQDRCVAVRNRNATCRRCVRACAMDALQVGGNEVCLDAAACVNCGACVAACPTEALVALDPPDAELVGAASRAMRRNGGAAVIACARVSARHEADPESYAEVPCLPRVDESLITSLVSQGATEVLLVDGDCSTCRYRDCTAGVDGLVKAANSLLEAHGSPVCVSRATGFPQRFRVESAEGLFGTTRRGFFSEAVATAKDTAITAAQATIAQELGPARKPAEIGERLRVTQAGTLPLVRVGRHEATIDALDRIGAPVVDRIESRLFASVSVDVGKCNACGMCAMFCPTGALRRDPAPRPNAPLRYLEFSAADCVQCGCCADVCWKGALSIDSAVSAAELYDFEPVVFDLARAERQTNALFGKTRAK